MADNYDMHVDDDDSPLSVFEERELSLSEVLKGLSNKEKRELLIFKRTHNEFEYEEELLRRNDMLAKRLDLQRLQQMAKGTRATPAKGKSAPTRTSQRSKRRIEDEEDEEEEEEEDAVEEEEDEDIEDEDEMEEAVEDDEAQDDDDEKAHEMEDGEEDDLFDSDEEKEVQQKTKKLAAAQAKKDKKDKYASKSSLASDSEEGEDDEEDEEEDDDSMDHDDRDEDDDSVRAARRRRKRDSAKEEVVDNSPEATYGHYLKLFLSRQSIIQWVAEPFFKKAVIGSFVRYMIGREGNETFYRLCEITDVDDKGPPYKVEPMNKDSVVTTMRFELSIGGHVKPMMKLDKLSNHRPSEQEVNLYKSAVSESRSKKQLTENAVDRILKARRQCTTQHKYTNEQINKMIKKDPKTVAKTTDATNALLKWKRKLNDEMRKEEKDMEAIAKIEKEIMEIEIKIRRDKEVMERASKARRAVNDRNKLANYEKDCILSQKKKQKQAEEGVVVVDPLVRRDTRPKVIWITGKRLAGEKERERLTAEINKIKAEIERVKQQGLLEEVTHLNNLLKEKEEALSQVKGANAGNTPALAPSAQLAAKAASNAVLSGGGVGPDEYGLHTGGMSIDEVRERVKQRLGVDPLEASFVPYRERYLNKVMESVGEDRESVRDLGISLSSYLRQKAKA